MRFSTIVMIATILVVFGIVSVAAANPALLPKHPGYPAGGQFANDPGQKQLSAEQALMEAAASEDAHIGQRLLDSSEIKMRLQEEGRQPSGDAAGRTGPATEGTHKSKK